MTKKAWVADFWNPRSEGVGWTLIFSRAFNDWELDLVERFLQMIQVIRVHRDVDDRMIWKTMRCGNFSVMSLYYFLEPGVSPLFLSGSIWRSCVPPKVAFFA